MLDLQHLHKDLRDQAVEAHKGLKQYDGKFDNWLMARAKRDMKARLYPTIIKGQYFLVSPETKVLEGSFKVKNNGRIMRTILRPTDTAGKFMQFSTFDDEMELV